MRRRNASFGWVLEGWGLANDRAEGHQFCLQGSSLRAYAESLWLQAAGFGGVQEVHGFTVEGSVSVTRLDVEHLQGYKSQSLREILLGKPQNKPEP